MTTPPHAPPAGVPGPADRKKVESFDTPERKLGFRVARIAHWLVNDSGYTKRMAARDLATMARELLPPELYESSIGDAGKP